VHGPVAARSASKIGNRLAMEVHTHAHFRSTVPRQRSGASSHMNQFNNQWVGAP
jgi:hypothetical protein